MKYILISTICIFLSISAFSQVDNMDIDKNIDSSWTIELEEDEAPQFILTEDNGTIKKAEAVDGDTIYPEIRVIAGDTTGFSPGKAGDLFIDSQNNKVYISKGAGRGKYILLNFLMLLLFIRRKS